MPNWKQTWMRDNLSMPSNDPMPPLEANFTGSTGEIMLAVISDRADHWKPAASRSGWGRRRAEVTRSFPLGGETIRRGDRLQRDFSREITVPGMESLGRWITCVAIEIFQRSCDPPDLKSTPFGAATLQRFRIKCVESAPAYRLNLKNADY